MRLPTCLSLRRRNRRRSDGRARFSDRRRSHGRARFARGPSAGSAAAAVGLALLVGCEAERETEPEGFKVLVDPAPSAHAAPPAPDPAIWETALTDPELEAGRAVWTGTCIDCHSTGLGGAPLIGNADLWQPRIDKGLEVLVSHATQGFYGKVGEMPARGGNPTLTDEDIERAVRFMVTRVDPSL